MEERQITVLDETYSLPQPFFVLATQNPIELEGTYPLPEAQLDRFLMKLLVAAPNEKELKEILNRTTNPQVVEAQPVLGRDTGVETILAMKRLVREVFVPEPLQDVMVRMIAALTPGNQFATQMTQRYVRFGPGPRGAQAAILTAKVHALLKGRINLAFEDLKHVILPCLRHRLILNFQAETDGVSADQIIDQVRSAK
jgi:MoxR-like ATPase